MSKPLEDRRKYDELIMNKIAESHDQLLVIDERQKVVLKRLDTINGTVADYNANKAKFINACDRFSIHEDMHKTLDERYVGFRFFRNASIILGVLITAMGVLNLLGIRLGG